MRHFLKIAYNGEGFHGWQIQPGDSSVQQTLEECLSMILRRPVEVVGAGRTDTGVHAREMFAHFDGSVPEDKESFLHSLNKVLGKYISVSDVLPVKDDAHARFDAVRRTYRYFISRRKNPFMRGRYWECPYSLDIDLMNKAGAYLAEISDFTSFAKLHSDARTNICNVSEARWEEYSSPFHNYEGIVFTISADRFLRNMVRAVVGTIVDVGRGKISLKDFEDIISMKDRCAAGTSAPAHGLYLWNVQYPDEIFIK